MHNILICDADEAMASAIEQYCQKKNYLTKKVYSGKDCQLQAYKGDYSHLILDIETKNHSAFEVLKYFRINCPNIQVIFSIHSEKQLKDLDLKSEDLKRLGVQDVLTKPYQIEELGRSIEGAKTFKAWRNAESTNELSEEEEVDAQDEDFTRLPIQEFYSGNTTIFDLYIRLGENNYVKILHQGDFFSGDRIRRYEDEKKITHLYFKTQDRNIYINFINQLLDKVSNSPKVNSEKKLKMVKNLTTKFVEETYTIGLQPHLIKEGKKICENQYQVLQSKPDFLRLLTDFQNADPDAASHQSLTSFFAAIITTNIEWASKRTVELVTFGALFHDIGKLKLPHEIRSLKPEEMTKEQLALYQQHPLHGMEMLSRCSGITEPILQIVYQHHEYVNGEGFPNGLKSNRIYPLAQIVALADEFAKFLETHKEPPLKVLEHFVMNRKNILRFDANAVKSLLLSFQNRRS